MPRSYVVVCLGNETRVYGPFESSEISPWLDKHCADVDFDTCDNGIERDDHEIVALRKADS